MLKESSLSSRWITEDMDAYERNNIYIAELGCTMGQAWGWETEIYLSIGDYESSGVKNSNYRH
jgi:hypothetical protein